MLVWGGMPKKKKEAYGNFTVVLGNNSNNI